jgi:cell fate (sporulation/competence/biofilm development) regulator YmcA (YheA/YmcA/DUF963 family)
MVLQMLKSQQQNNITYKETGKMNALKGSSKISRNCPKENKNIEIAGKELKISDKYAY